MILGVGTDLLRRDRLAPAFLGDDSALVRKTYTDAERRQALARPDPARYLQSRFAAKEAVFKSLGADPQHARLIDIEVLGGSDVPPTVTLHGGLAAHAAHRGIIRVLLSLSYETDHVIAFAIAVGGGAHEGVIP